MADTAPNRRSGPSRLQRRAPASIQVNRCTDWNVAIPLLSPLASSPPSVIPTAQVESSSRLQRASLPSRSDQTKAVVFKKWQHPAAPFCYEPTPSFGPFVSCNEVGLRMK